MLAIDLINHDLENYLEKVKTIRRNEFCYIRLNSILKATSAEINFIKLAATLTDEVALSVPLEDVYGHDFISQFNEFKIKTLCVRVKTAPEKFANIYNSGTHNSGDLDLINAVSFLIASCPEGKAIACEFSDEADFRIMGSTVARLYENGLKWIVLNPGEVITDQGLKKYRDFFDVLRMRRCNKLNAYFNFLSPMRLSWQLQTLNTFSGIREVHIDISNKCTHRCEFCGLYGETARRLVLNCEDQKIIKNVRDYMQMEIDPVKAFEIIASLPFDTERIQFGGAGDPLLHSYALEFIQKARDRGFYVDILTNLEYLDEESVHMLSDLGTTNSDGISFIVNLSGATPQTYLKTRPKQNLVSFNKVDRNIRLFTKLRQENNRGAWITLMSVITKNNHDKLVEYAEYAKEADVQGVWFKPMEVHADQMRKFLLTEVEKPIFKTQMHEAMKILDSNNIFMVMREYYEQIIN